jgi:hypothetical protein
MVFKLTKAETVARDRLVADLRAAHEHAERTISAYNVALQAVRDFVEQRATAWRGQHDKRNVGRGATQDRWRMRPSATGKVTNLRTPSHLSPR